MVQAIFGFVVLWCKPSLGGIVFAAPDLFCLHVCGLTVPQLLICGRQVICGLDKRCSLWGIELQVNIR